MKLGGLNHTGYFLISWRIAGLCRRTLLQGGRVVTAATYRVAFHRERHYQVQLRFCLQVVRVCSIEYRYDKQRRFDVEFAGRFLPAVLPLSALPDLLVQSNL